MTALRTTTFRQLAPSSRDDVDLLELYGDAPDRYVRAGLATSLDGVVAVSGRSAPLSGPADRQVFRALRGVCDVVLVGAGTARTEGYGPVRLTEDAVAWRAAHDRAAIPPIAVVSRGLDLAPGSRLFEQRPIVVTCEAAPAERRHGLADRADLIVAGDDAVDVVEAIAQLAERGLTRVLCEGGPHLLHAALSAGVVDELCLTVSPTLVGGGPHLLPAAVPARARWRLRHLVQGDDLLFARWTSS
jgi:riboflavin biosynthesis pyrimidine reductase